MESGLYRMTFIQCVSLRRRHAFTDDGRELPVTNMFDIFGDETSDPGLCVTFVCGSSEEWYVERTEDYDRRGIV